MPRGMYDRSKSKKKTNGAVKHVKVSRDSEPSSVQLTEVELLKMEKLSTQVRACDADTVITQAQRASHLSKIDPQGLIARFDLRIQALRKEREEAEVAYRAVTAGIEKRLGIKLHEHSYDDKTGVLHKLTDVVVNVPTAKA